MSVQCIPTAWHNQINVVIVIDGAWPVPQVDVGDRTKSQMILPKSKDKKSKAKSQMQEVKKDKSQLARSQNG